ncbi:MAG TPA: MBL fold metallo-hydrolase [Desulfobulbaceae bacterium]|nr:MBL fold metallo-hydrolase [Desulfobulbaceae bacterium]
MRFSILGSGSRGNSVFIESGKTAILIDAGFSGKEIHNRLRSIGRDLSEIRALCITHEHNDHICGVGVIARRFGIPAYANPGTFAGGDKKIGKVGNRMEFETGNILQIDDLEVRSFRISHDTSDPVGFLVSDGKVSLGYCTDTGQVSRLIATRLAKCNGLILEFNHNLAMLKNGPYPLSLQQRVRSSQGHLCNEDAAELLAQLIGDHLRIAVLAHLSETNNTPELARAAALQAVAEWGSTSLVIASQEKSLPLTEI